MAADCRPPSSPGGPRGPPRKGPWWLWSPCGGAQRCLLKITQAHRDRLRLEPGQPSSKACSGHPPFSASPGPWETPALPLGLAESSSFLITGQPGGNETPASLFLFPARRLPRTSAPSRSPAVLRLPWASRLCTMAHTCRASKLNVAAACWGSESHGRSRGFMSRLPVRCALREKCSRSP